MEINKGRESQQARASTLHDLRRIEGQIRGVAHMVEDERNYADIQVQLAAIACAARRIGLLLLEEHIRACMATLGNDGERDASASGLCEAVARLAPRSADRSPRRVSKPRVSPSITPARRLQKVQQASPATGLHAGQAPGIARPRSTQPIRGAWQRAG